MRRKIHKEDILTAGKNLMHKYGYNAVSIKDITDEVKIPKGSFYNHYSSKNEFLLAAMESYAEESYLLFKKHLIDSDASPLTRLKNYFEEAIAFYGANNSQLNGCLVGNTCQELANVDTALRETIESTLSGTNPIIEQLLLDAQALGEIHEVDSPSEMANFITNSWQGALLRMKAKGDNTPLITFKRILFNQLLK